MHLNKIQTSTWATHNYSTPPSPSPPLHLCLPCQLIVILQVLFNCCLLRLLLIDDTLIPPTQPYIPQSLLFSGFPLKAPLIIFAIYVFVPFPVQCLSLQTKEQGRELWNLLAQDANHLVCMCSHYLPSKILMYPDTLQYQHSQVELPAMMEKFLLSRVTAMNHMGQLSTCS